MTPSEIAKGLSKARRKPAIEAALAGAAAGFMLATCVAALTIKPDPRWWQFLVGAVIWGGFAIRAIIEQESRGE